VGGLIQALLPFAVIPVYLRLLGAEAYGLLVLNASILAALLFFDRLISLTIIREFGRRNGEAGEGVAMRRLLRSFEIVSLGLAILVAIAVMLVAPMLAGGWPERSGLPPGTLATAFLLMGFVIAAQWPGYLYAAGIAGLQRQALLSVMKAASALLLHGGGVLMLLLTNGGVLGLLCWQLAVFTLQSAVLGLLAWRVMPSATEKPRFDAALVQGLWRMALGALLVSLLASAAVQLDKFIVARLATPEVFAAYGLSFMAVSAILGVVAGSLGTAMHPLFSGLIARGEEAQLSIAYHRWVQAAAIALVPAGVAVAAFPEPLLTLWLGAESATARLATGVLPPLAIGALLLTLLGPMSTLLAAAGWHTPALVSHAVAVAAILLLLPSVVSTHGVVAAAWMMTAVGGAYHVGLGFMTHQRLLRGAFAKALIMGVV
ncbi:MAG: oligosaccharide flippase family protein, partial [Beijerinckiaceae bacterium]